MSKSDSEFPSAVGFSREAQDEDDLVLTERDLKQKQRFQQAMLAQKIKRNTKAAPGRPIDAPVNRKKKGEYFQLPMGEGDED